MHRNLQFLCTCKSPPMQYNGCKSVTNIFPGAPIHHICFLFGFLSFLDIGWINLFLLAVADHSQISLILWKRLKYGNSRVIVSHYSTMSEKVLVFTSQISIGL